MHDTIAQALKQKEFRVRVKSGGMYQYIVLKATPVDFGSDKSMELFTDRNLEIREAERISNELGFPVHTRNCKAFPKGKGAKDFIVQ
jgi:hypothetical protein